ncbi:MAG: ribosomal RNA small subunit methyltransferase A [Candidatus Marinimicrobia bacterium]|nr:ribosomal RNA small subunit methyltransferase A [Candidatus Neomarinimicrobiota bacterium]MBL7023671.1 ribosomal RNA small subunit methyltransferase A [Candidatus Neomarinimicrobiota bacterium]MBL7109838.1 ribosomal RNA small subunit methyltransferase A [Candidatus Neomarinimicrobiota bacterium]
MKHPIRKKWGQNFLQDPNIIRKIVDVVNPIEEDVILEIGPGKGALTFELTPKVKQLIAVEIDPLLVEYLNKRKQSNLVIHQADILDFGFNQMEYKYLIVGNLPYNITSPIIFKLLENTNWNKAVFMVQNEVAERMSAKPGNKIYGRLSVMVQAFAKVQYHFKVPPGVFFPQPDVNSAVISLTPIRRNIDDRLLFTEIVRTAFGQRRKKIRNTLKSYLVENKLEQIGDLRPEDLAVSDFIDISNSCKEL